MANSPSERTLYHYKSIHHEAEATVWATRLHMKHTGLIGLLNRIRARLHGVTMQNYKEFLPKNLIAPEPNFQTIEQPNIDKPAQAQTPPLKVVTPELSSVDEQSLFKLKANATAYFSDIDNQTWMVAHKNKANKVHVSIYNADGEEYQTEVQTEQDAQELVAEYGKLKTISEEEFRQNVMLRTQDERVVEEQLRSIQELLLLRPVNIVKINDLLIEKIDQKHFKLTRQQDVQFQRSEQQEPQATNQQKQLKTYSQQALMKEVKQLAKHTRIDDVEYDINEKILLQDLAQAVQNNHGEPLHFKKTIKEHGKEKCLFDFTVKFDPSKEELDKQQDEKQQERQNNPDMDKDISQVNEFMGALSIVDTNGHQMSVNQLPDIMDMYALDGELHKALCNDVRTDIDEYNLYESKKDLSYEDAPREHETSHSPVLSRDDDDDWMVRTLDNSDYYYEEPEDTSSDE